VEATRNLSPLLVVAKVKPAGGAGRADVDGEAAAEDDFELEDNEDDAIELALDETIDETTVEELVFKELATVDELEGFMEEDC
jgi:hypothetical protein